MPKTLGKKIWVIPEGFIPKESNGPVPQMLSHETASILNTGNDDAHIEITIYFSNKEPVGPYEVTVPGKRTLHLQFNNLKKPQPIPKDTDYASVFVSDVPVIIQHTRLDSRQAENALLSTMAYAAD